MGWITTLLLFGVLLYVMIRFGCGSHTGHGRHRNQLMGHAGASNGNDPVCGMEVDGDTGYREVYQGHEYRFCSRNCLDKFDAEPQHFAQQSGAAA